MPEAFGEGWLVYLLFPLIGMVSGLLAGLFGIGGGLVIVPALNLFFAIQPADSGWVSASQASSLSSRSSGW